MYQIQREYSFFFRFYVASSKFKNIKVGDLLNTEIDMIARYTFRALEGKT